MATTARTGMPHHGASARSPPTRSGTAAMSGLIPRVVAASAEREAEEGTSPLGTTITIPGGGGGVSHMDRVSRLSREVVQPHTNLPDASMSSQRTHSWPDVSNEDVGHSAVQISHTGLQKMTASSSKDDDDDDDNDDSIDQPGSRGLMSPTRMKLDRLRERNERLRALRAHRIDLAWRMLLPATAECLISEFLPSAKTEAGIDLASTFANTLGAFLEGVTYGVERQSGSRSTQNLCAMTRTYFLNVFTSFPFVAVHAAEMCSLNGPLMGAGYALTSLGIAVAAFELGRRPVEGMLAEVKVSPLHWTWRIGTDENRQRMLAGLAGIVIVSLLKTKMAMAQSAMGFFGDAADADGGAAAATHTLETMVGIAFAIAGALLGGHMGSCIRANFLSCLFIGAAFALRRLLGWEEVGGAQAAEGSAWWVDVVFTKFVGSFCGAMSGFAAMLSDYGKLMHHENRNFDAMLEFSGNVAIAMLWMVVFYAFDRHGLDVYSHAFRLKSSPFQY